MTGADLEQATRVEGEDGRYVAQLSDAWEIWGPNGGYLAAIGDQARREDCEALADLMAKATKQAPRMWGASIVGFGSYRYRYASGREGESCVVGFSSRRGDISVYGLNAAAGAEELRSRLGKHKAGKGCVYIKRLSDVDLKGRHTTTHRELVPLPEGAILLDTPGMRELQLWEAGDGIVDAFADVEDVALQCRFSDCAHDGEPGCAIQAALGDGSLDPERWDSYTKLQRELHWLDVRQSAKLSSEQRKQWRRFERSRRKAAY